MHYYSHNIGDYRKDTGHLSALEHGIYRQLIDWYYLDEKPIPKETQVVSRRLRLASESEIKALENVLTDFFELRDDGYHQARCDDEIANYHRNAEKNKNNGKLGGRPKKTQSVILGNPNETQSKGNQEPITINQEPEKENTPPRKRSAATPKISKPVDVDEQVWSDFLTIRKAKGAPLTATALAGIEREAVKAGITLQAALETCCARGWQGFKAEWMQREGLSGSATALVAPRTKESFYERDQRLKAEQVAKFAPGVAAKSPATFDFIEGVTNVTAIESD